MIIPLLDVTLQGLPDWSLSERDIDVLAFIAEEEFRIFTFEGLKRRLGLHSETLSRILDRLEEEGIVKKSSQGYTVTKEIAKHLRQHPGAEGNSRVTLLQTFLPTDLPVEELISNLRGRWFGLLRWLGFAKSEEGVALKWVTEDGSIQIDAKITLNTLTIEAKFLHGYNRDLALRAAYQLMTHISKLSAHTHSQPMATHVGYFGDSDYYLMPS
jgi:CRISPR/Cas system CSM-associated protein Csm4 (group 5 of RAMP superfamily)